MSTRRRIATVAIAVAIAAAGSGTAFAYFTSTGSGTGIASVGSSTTWGVSVSDDTTHTLLPGGSEELPITITNNGTGDQAFTTVAATVVADGSGDVEAGGTPVIGCLATWFTVTVADNMAPPAGTALTPDQAAAGTVILTMTDAPTDQDACQGITGPDVTVSVS